MSEEFCVKCAAKEAQIEIMRTQHYEQIQELTKRLEILKDENDRLSLDLAFYSGAVTNLSCDNR